MFKNNLSAYDRTMLATALVASITLALVFHRTFGFLYANWQREEYSHGIFIPLISAYLLWLRRHQFRSIPLTSSWWGVAIVIGGLALFLLGSVASINGLDAYALVIVVAGCVLAAIGWPGFKLAAAPIALLLLMNPLPTFWHNSLSSELQLISSQVGVVLIRLLGVSVFLEGNVIDLGSYKLQVAEACSGLRYLFPLMTLGAVLGYLFRGRLWMRWCVFASTIPIAVLMNSLRIAAIGVLVDHYGSAQAEGFLHQFEGWVIFMACFGMLLLECILLPRVVGDRRSLRELLGFHASSPAGLRVRAPSRGVSRPAIAVAIVSALTVYPAMALPQRIELHPARSDFSQFPLSLGAWIGKRDRLEDVYLNELRLDDYVLANFVNAANPRSATGVNLYIAYYDSQRAGQSVHSPRSCLPGGGWRIDEFGQRELAVPGQRPMRVNRALIQQGSDRQLVYYWFQERGRNLTSEYAVKWYLFADALTRNRTDGALVRLTTPLLDGESAAAGESRLTRLTGSLLSILDRFVPN